MSDFTYDKDDDERRAIDVDGLITAGTWVTWTTTGSCTCATASATW